MALSSVVVSSSSIFMMSRRPSIGCFSVLLDAGADLLYPSMTALAEDWNNLMNIIKVS